MKKRFLPLSMLLITMVLAQASFVANAAGVQGKYTPRTNSNATISSFMKSIRANQETGLIDPADLIAGQKAAQASRDTDLEWAYAGPDNFGGETRAVIYDNQGNLLIGTMGGDIFKSTNNGITFQRMAHIDAPISCFVMKGNELYIGTGDGFDTQLLNGLSVIGYETSFVGAGVYKMEGNNGVLVAGTENIAFVNEMTVVGNDIYAATNEGLMKNWSVVLEGDIRSVKSNSNGDILAADNTKNVYLAKAGGEFTQLIGTGNLPNKDQVKIIAMSPSNPDYMYIAYLNNATGSAYSTGNIYYTNDGGNNWNTAYTSTTLMYPIFGDNASHAGFMAVYPDNPKKLLIGSDYLWTFEDATTGGGDNNYLPVRISEYNCDQFSPIAWNRYYYLHQGVLNIVFSKDSSATFFIGTDGGIFKGEYYESLYSYKGGNRYFITEAEHTSPMRMMSVAVGGGTTTIGGSLENGTIMMLACDTIDNITTGKAIFPNPTATNNSFGYFTNDYAGGPCFISTINPDIMIVSGTGALDMPLHRTETSGEDYDLTKFSAEGVISNSDAFRTPFAVYETYTDAHSSVEINELFDSLSLPLDTLAVYLGDTVYINDNFHITQGQIWAADTAFNYNHITVNDTLYIINDTSLYIDIVYHDTIVVVDINFDTLFLAVKQDAKAGDIRHYYSNQANYPISYSMPEPPHDDAHIDPEGGYKWIPGDTITGLHDPIKSNLVCAISGKIYMTRDALIFNKDTDWFLITKTVSGLPTAVTISADGNTAYVGTDNGTFYKITNLDEAFTEEQADVTNTLNPCIEIFTNESSFTDRAITSIAVNPNNANDVIVTLGNYGNTEYVFRSTDGGSNFTSIQGNLGRFPVYSSLIEKSSGLLILGTEHGIFTSTNGSNWTRTGNISCPVMELKQAILANHDDVIDILVDEMGNPTYVTYPGIHNEGMIYAATYGNGIVSSATYKEGSDFDVDEVYTDNEIVSVNVYPNPVRGNGQFVFTVRENANVSYEIFDLSGRMLEYRMLGYYGEGEHTASFTTENLANGTYIIRVIAGDHMNTAKFLVY